MNRQVALLYQQVFHVPHTRGDEPELRFLAGREADMFPTHVGMNRAWICRSGWRVMFPTHVGMNRCTRLMVGFPHHVPHTRGDEPNESRAAMLTMQHVPHTRGDEPIAHKAP